MLLHFIPTKPIDNYQASPLSGFQYSQHHLGSVVGTSRHSAYIILLNPHNTGKYVLHARLADEETDGSHTPQGSKLGFEHWATGLGGFLLDQAALWDGGAGQDRRPGLTGRG